MVVVFFFQAEDGIRDGRVTGVQTCALPIFAWEKGRDPAAWFVMGFFLSPLVALIALSAVPARHLARVRAARRARGAARSRPAESSRMTAPVTAAARLVGGVRERKVNA